MIIGFAVRVNMRNIRREKEEGRDKFGLHEFMILRKMIVLVEITLMSMK